MKNRGIPIRTKFEDPFDDSKSTMESDIVTLPKKQNKKSSIPKSKAVENDNVPKRFDVGGKIKTLTEKNETLQKTILVLEKKNKFLESQNQRLESEFSQLKEDKDKDDDMLRELKRKAESADSLQKKLMSLQGECKMKDEKAILAENALAEKEQQLEDYKNSTESKHFELQHLIQENEAIHLALQEKDSIISENTKTIEELNENISKLTLENSELSSHVLFAETEKDTIFEKLNEKKNESEALKLENAAINQKLNDSNETIASLQKEIASIKQQNKEENMNLQSNYASQMNENTELKGSLREKEIVINEMKLQQTLMEKNMKELQNNLSDLKDEKDSITEQYNSINEHLQNANSQIKTLEQKIKLLNQTISTKENEMHDMKLRYDEIQSLKENQNGIKEDSFLATIEKQQNEISKKCKEIEKLNAQLSDTNSISMALQDKIQIITDDNKCLQTKCNSLESQISTLKGSNHQYEIAATTQQNENEQLTSEITRLSLEIENSNSQIAALTTENQNLQEQINQLTEAADQINDDNYKLKAETKENQKLNSRCKELERLNVKLHDEHEKVIQENSKMKRELNEKNNEIKALQNKQVAEENACRIEYVQRIMELDEELRIYRQSPSLSITESKVKTYEDQIRKLNTKIQSLQAEIDKREMKKLGHNPSGEKSIIQAQKAKLQEQERIIEHLRFQNQTMINEQANYASWKDRFEELVKRDVESRENLKKSFLQYRYRCANEIENPPSQM